MNYNSRVGRVPAVFISSTCYDLKQIRSDLSDFFSSKLVYEPILSENNTFPTDSNFNTIDTCMRIVEEKADLFVLMVGKRYGYVTEQDKSITNLEYLRAKVRGIPIYVFVDKALKLNLSIWKDNPNGNFSSIVDNTKIFEFVDELYNQDGIWVYEFETVKDIISTLKNQLAYLFNDCLSLRARLNQNLLSSKVSNYSGEVFRIVVEKPDYWEYILFAKTLKQNLSKLTDLKYDLKYGISLNKIITLNTPTDIFDWVAQKSEELVLIVSFLTPIMGKAYSEAVGASGESGNAEYIIYVAEKLIGIYKQVIQWSLDFRNVIVPEDFKNLLIHLSKCSHNTIEDIETFIGSYSIGIQDIISGINSNKHVEFTLTLREPNLDDFHNEINTIKKIYLG